MTMFYIRKHLQRIFFEVTIYRKGQRKKQGMGILIPLLDLRPTLACEETGIVEKTEYTETGRIFPGVSSTPNNTEASSASSGAKALTINGQHDIDEVNFIN